MDGQADGASSSSSSEVTRSSHEVAGELEQLERRRQELQNERERAARVERGPIDREEAFVTGIVELVLGAAQHKPIPELRRRAAKLLEAVRS